MPPVCYLYPFAHAAENYCMVSHYITCPYSLDSYLPRFSFADYAVSFIHSHLLKIPVQTVRKHLCKPYSSARWCIFFKSVMRLYNLYIVTIQNLGHITHDLSEQ